MAIRIVALADVRQALADIGREDAKYLSDEELQEKYLWSDLELYPDDISDMLCSLKERHSLYVSNFVKRQSSYGIDMTVREFIAAAARGF